MDVVLIAGYNDLILGRSREDIMESFRQFSQLVLDASTDQRDRNTVAICNMVYPPQIAWFPDNGPLPPNHRGNELLKLEILNECILSLNMDNGITEFPRLHKYGVRNYTKKWVDRYGQERHRQIRRHRFEHWREEDPSRMLHLINEQRFKMGAAINKYFLLRTNTTW